MSDACRFPNLDSSRWGDPATGQPSSVGLGQLLGVFDFRTFRRG
jgi:hypothetical protein